MKNTKAIPSILFLVIFSSLSFAQNTSTEEWTRIQSDNGNVSFLIPPKYNYFFSDKGVNSKHGFQLKKMQLIRGFYDDTIVGFESYQEGKSLVSEFIESDALKYEGNLKTQKKTRNGIEFRQLEDKSDKYYLVRQYIYLNNSIYIFTAASRNGKTETMNKFLDSIELKEKNVVIDPATPKISGLNKTQIEVVSKDVKSIADSERSKKDRTSPILLLRPNASYTENSRGISGTVQLRYFYLETGFVNKIEVVTPLPQGLTWQVISSLIKSVRLPGEMDGKLIPGQSIYEYTYTTY